MPGDLLGMFIFTGATLAAVLGYVVWRHVSEARAASRAQAGDSGGAAVTGTPSPAVANPWRPVAVLCGALVLGGLALWWDLAGRDNAEPVPAAAATMAGRFPGPWRGDYREDLQRALSAAGAGECRFHYREGSERGAFLAYCPGAAADDWRAYLVWLPSGRTVGPLAPSPDIPRPE